MPGWLTRNIQYIVRPDLDPRRMMERADQRIINERWSAIGSAHASSVPIVSGNKWEQSELNTVFNDCISHIKAHKVQHWRIFTWTIAAVSAIAAFGASSHGSAIPNIASVPLIILVGVSGIYFMNEESVQLERNRNHLDAIRACMHGSVVEIYLDRPTPDSNSSIRRTHMKRARDLTMNVAVAVWSLTLVSLFIVA